jgi:hypothetical protein
MTIETRDYYSRFLVLDRLVDELSKLTKTYVIIYYGNYHKTGSFRSISKS